MRLTAAGLSGIHTRFPFNSAFAETNIHCIYLSVFGLYFQKRLQDTKKNGIFKIFATYS